MIEYETLQDPKCMGTKSGRVTAGTKLNNPLPYNPTYR